MRILFLLLTGVATLPAAAAPTRFAGVDAQVESMLTAHGLPGAVLMLAQDGVLVHQRAYGSYALDTRVPIASASKWMSAALVARLVDQGRLHWDDTLAQHVPEVPADKANLTLRQLFSMTSGIPGGDLRGASPCLADRATTLAACSAEILQLPLTGTPGSVMDYGGNAMQVAGHMVERATGESWNDLFRREVAAPLGMTSTHYSLFPDIDSANPRIAGGMFSTAGDYMKLLLMWQAHGKAGTRRLLNSATVTEMDRDQTVGTRVISSPLPGAGYGIGHWVEAKDAQGHSSLVSSPGAFGFTPWLDLRRDIAGVLLVFGDLSATRSDTQLLIDQVANVLDKNIDQVPFADFGGIWWRPQESGSGLTLVQRADHQLSGTFYTFDDEGQALWLVFAGGRWESSARWRGGLYRSRYGGSGALSTGVNPALVSTTAFGQIVFVFSDAHRGELTLELASGNRVLPIERFPF
jgi:CubicO group peptidase (beta-lactamase class C family)